MVTSEERLAHLEGRVAEQSQMFVSLRETIGQFEQRVDHRFAQIDHRFEQFERRVDERFEHVDRRFEQFEQRVDRRFEQIDRRFEQVDQRFGQVDARLMALDQKIDALDMKLTQQIGALSGQMVTQFRWTLGLVFTGFVAMTAAILGR